MSEAYRIFHEKAVQEGLHEGIVKGEQKATILIAKNLLSHGIELAVIAETTGLRIDEVEKLRDIH